jgi:hypothetical protein
MCGAVPPHTSYVLMVWHLIKHRVHFYWMLFVYEQGQLYFNTVSILMAFNNHNIKFPSSYVLGNEPWVP